MSGGGHGHREPEVCGRARRGAPGRAGCTHTHTHTKKKKKKKNGLLWLTIPFVSCTRTPVPRARAPVVDMQGLLGEYATSSSSSDDEAAGVPPPRAPPAEGPGAPPLAAALPDPFDLLNAPAPAGPHGAHPPRPSRPSLTGSKRRADGPPMRPPASEPARALPGVAKAADRLSLEAGPAPPALLLPPQLAAGRRNVVTTDLDGLGLAQPGSARRRSSGSGGGGGGR